MSGDSISVHIETMGGVLSTSEGVMRFGAGMARFTRPIG